MILLYLIVGINLFFLILELIRNVNVHLFGYLNCFVWILHLFRKCPSVYWVLSNIVERKRIAKLLMGFSNFIIDLYFV